MIISRKIASGELSLRTLTADTMSGNYAAWLNDKDLMQYTESRFKTHTQSDVLAFVEKCNASANSLLLGIFSGETHIGNIKADIDPHHKTAGIGLLIGDKGFHGQGIGFSAITLLSDYLFKECGIYKINAGIYEANVSSVRAFEKAGYKTEYIKRAHVINADGRREDVAMMVKYADQ